MTAAPSATAAAPATFGSFFLPGPTEVRREILEAMLRPMIPHRGREFETLFARLQVGLKKLFRTERPVFVSSSSATGLMEAAVRAAPVGRVLSLVNGAFAERFAQIARACGRDVDAVEVPWGRAADLDDVARRLRARRYAALTVVHSETSTGVLTDVRAISDRARAEGVTCLVDSVSGVAGTPLEFDTWELDFALTGSQKALALPPGLALGVASPEFMRSAASAPARGLYLDVVEMERFALKNQTPNTPVLPLLYALDAQLEAIERETVEGRWARHAAMAEAMYRWVEERAGRFEVGVLAPPGERSPTVTAVTLPEGLTGGDVARAIAARGIVVSGGYGTLAARTFRIGHMGDHTPATLARCLRVCDDALAERTGR